MVEGKPSPAPCAIKRQRVIRLLCGREFLILRNSLCCCLGRLLHSVSALDRHRAGRGMEVGRGLGCILAQRQKGVPQCSTGDLFSGEQ